MSSQEPIGSAYVAIRADGSRLQPEIQSALEQALGPAVASGAKILAGLFVGKEALGFAREGIAELVDAEKQSALTGAQIKATGGAAGITAAHIEELAQANLKLVGTNDEVTVSAARTLLQFTHITAAGGVFDAALQGAQDLAITTGQDLPSAAHALGLALQDPTKATRTLRAENIALTVSQQEQIKEFIKSGDLLGAQKVILDIVAQHVGGTAAAYGETLGGSLLKARSELTETRKSLVDGAAPALQFVADAAVTLNEDIQALPGPLRTAVSTVLGLGVAAASLTPLISQIAVGFRAIHPASLAATAATTELNAASAELIVTNEALVASFAARANATLTGTVTSAVGSAGSSAIGALGTSLVGVGAGLSGLIAPAGLAVAALGGVLAITGSLSTEETHGAGAVEALTNALREQSGVAAGQVNTQIAGLLTTASEFPGVFQKAGANLTPFINSIRAGGEDIHALDRAIKGEAGATSAFEAFNQAIADGTLKSSPFNDELRRLVQTGAINEQQFNQINDVLHQTTGSYSSATDGAKALDYAQQQGAAASRLATDAISGYTVAQQASITAAEKEFTSGQALTSAHKGVETALRSVASATQSYENSLRSLTQAQQSVQDAQKALDDALAGGQGGEVAGKAALDLQAAQQGLVDANNALTKAQTENVSAFAPGVSEAQHTKNLTDAQIAQQRAVYGVADAEKALNAAQKVGTDQDPAVISARRGLENALQGVASAQQSVNAANQSLVDARAGVESAQAAEAKAAIDYSIALQGALEPAQALVTSVDTQVYAYSILRDTLAPGSPLRKNIDDYIAQLRILAYTQKPAPTSTSGLGSDTDLGIGLASGFAGTINRPTRLVVGEGGEPEDLLVAPHSQGGIRAIAAATTAPAATTSPVSDAPLFRDLILQSPDPSQSLAVVMGGLRSARWSLGRRI